MHREEWKESSRYTPEIIPVEIIIKTFISREREKLKTFSSGVEKEAKKVSQKEAPHENYCDECSGKAECKEICPDLEEYLSKDEVKFQGNTSLLSSDYQDKVFTKDYKTDIEAREKRQQYMKRRKEAFGELVEVFSEGKKCCGKCVRNFMVFQMREQDGLTTREVAEITGLTHPRITQLVNGMKKMWRRRFTKTLNN